jgi:hypothetical protein
MLVVFAAGLVVMFMPIFEGQNALEYLDVLYNSISKGSANYIAMLEDDVATYEGTELDAVLKMKGDTAALATAALLEQAGASIEIAGAEVTVRGDLAMILRGCLRDSEEMFRNEDGPVQARYGLEGKEALFAWWSTLRALDRELKKQERFPEAALVLKVKKKAVECAYNYFGIEPMRVSDNLGIVVFSLVFYVLYTVWYGYAIILLFEGFGLRLSH